MASFTDQIPKFNPYIQQLPVEAMVAVGMEKQKRYDEGVQKIQQTIDNVAGLEVTKDVDKAYLQSKLNELGSSLRTFAASDFSDFQLVNSVSGMTKQIASDPNIQNAVSSTKAYKKGVEDMNTLIKEGKGSSSRTWEFKLKANEWLNSSDLNASFNATYKPYTNYRKNATEIVKELTGDSTITDDSFNIDAKGNLVIKDAITRTKLAGISPEKIQQALLVGLSPDDWEQMSVDGRYNYSNTTPESFSKSLNESYKNKFDAFAEQKTILENAKMSTSSAVEKAKIDQKILQIDKTLNNIQQEYNSISKTFSEGDVESAKSRLFTTNFMNGFSKAFSFTETSQTYENSPFADMQMRREVKAQEWKKFVMEYNQRAQHHGENRADKAEELRLKKLEVEGYGPFPAAVDKDDIPDVGINDINKQIENDETAVNKQDINFMSSQGKDKTWLDQQRIAWMKSPNGVDPIVRQHFERTEPVRRQIDENTTMLELISAEADRRYGDIYKNIPKNAQSLEYKSSDGTIYVYSPKEFVDFNTKVNKYIRNLPSEKVTSVAGPVYVSQWNDELAAEELTKKEYFLYKIYKGDKKGKATDVLLNEMTKYRRDVNIPYAKTIIEKDKFMSDEVSRRVVASQGLEYSIPTDSKTQQESLSSILSSVVTLAKSQKGAIAKSPGLDLSVLEKIAESGNGKATIKVIEGTEFAPAMYEVTARGTDGITNFKLTPEQKYSIFGSRFEPSPSVQAFRPYQRMMQKYSNLETGTDQTNQYLSTSPSLGPTSISNSSLGPTDFFNIKSYGVSGNIISADNGRTYSLRMNFYDPISKNIYEDVPYPRLLQESEVVPLMQGLTDSAIYELLNGKSATSTDLKKLQNASKNPF